MRFNNAKLVSFSGVDGAGKSTQIDSICRHLEKSGFTFVVYRFWDDVVVFSRFREHASLRAFKGDKGVGSPEKPITRRDKNVRSWYLTALRLFFYLLDSFRLCIVVARTVETGVDFIVFDRYIYDELANLPVQYLPIRMYVRALLMFIPRPDLPLLLDADPEDAALRKPEYPLEFVRHNRDAYLRLSRIVRCTTVVPPLPIPQATELITESLAAKCLHLEVDSSCIQFPYPLPAGPAKTSNSENVPTGC